MLAFRVRSARLATEAFHVFKVYPTYSGSDAVRTILTSNLYKLIARLRTLPSDTAEVLEVVSALTRLVPPVTKRDEAGA